MPGVALLRPDTCAPEDPLEWGRSRGLVRDTCPERYRISIARVRSRGLPLRRFIISSSELMLILISHARNGIRQVFF